MARQQGDSVNDIVDGIATMYTALRRGYSPEWRGGEVEDGVLHAAWVNYSDVIYPGLAALQRVGALVRETAADFEGIGNPKDTASGIGDGPVDAGKPHQEETAFERYAHIRDKPIESLTAEEVSIVVQYLQRGDRYNEGLIKGWIDQDKRLERLARRGLELLGRNL